MYLNKFVTSLQIQKKDTPFINIYLMRDMGKMKESLDISLIITTYNNPEFLRLSLESILRQVILPSEVIIADDGSTEKTRILVQEYKKKLPIPLLHVWQPDEGFQAAKIRNIAIAVAHYDYIIQIDGDIIMEQHFVADHLYHRQKNTILQGSRVFITEKKTKRILENNYLPYLSFWDNGLRKKENMLRSRKLSSFLSTRYRNRYPIYYARGCNMSFYKEDFVKVNGYNNEFSGWGHEDSELTLRMLNAGCKKLYIKFHCVVFHLYHSERSRDNEMQNKKMMDEQVKMNSKYCRLGFNEILSTASSHLL